MDKSDCDTWAKNKLVNPKTGRKIQEGKGVYNKIKEDCDKHLTSPKGPSKRDGKSSPSTSPLKGEKVTKLKSKSPSPRTKAKSQQPKMSVPRKRRANILIVDEPVSVLPPPIKEVKTSPPKVKSVVTKSKVRPSIPPSKRVKSPPPAKSPKGPKTVTMVELYNYFNEQFQKPHRLFKEGIRRSSIEPIKGPFKTRVVYDDISHYYVSADPRNLKTGFDFKEVNKVNKEDSKRLLEWIKENDDGLGIRVEGPVIEGIVYDKNEANLKFLDRVQRAIDATNTHYKDYVVSGSSKVKSSTMGPKEGKFTKEECEEWQENKTVNPKTGRKIVEGKGVYNTLQKECESISPPSSPKIVGKSVLKKVKQSEASKSGKSILKRTEPFPEKKDKTVTRRELYDYFDERFRKDDGGSEDNVPPTPLNIERGVLKDGNYYLRVIRRRKSGKGAEGEMSSDMLAFIEWLRENDDGRLLSHPDGHSKGHDYIFAQNDDNDEFLARVIRAVNATNIHFEGYTVVKKDVKRATLRAYLKERYTLQDNQPTTNADTIEPLNLQVIEEEDVYHLSGAEGLYQDIEPLKGWLIQRFRKDGIRPNIRPWIGDQGEHIKELKGSILYDKSPSSKRFTEKLKYAIDATNTHYKGYNVIGE